MGPAVEDTDDGDVLAPAEALSSDAEDVDEPEPEPGDGGFGDPDGIVRLWFSEDRLSRVRVSARWREKLKERSLDSYFALALARANMRVAELPSRETAIQDDVDFSQLPRISTRSLAVFRSMFEETQQRWDAALERRKATQSAASPAATGTAKGITVKLDAAGRVASISLDPKWLESADHVSIRRHVMRAQERARARFVPVEDDRAELAGIGSEHRLLMTAFEAMLNPKEKS